MTTDLMWTCPNCGREYYGGDEPLPVPNAKGQCFTDSEGEDCPGNPPSNLLVSETYLNATEGWGLGESGVYESFTDNKGTLFRAMQREYGRCISSVYVDGPDGKVMKIGWVFQKNDTYQDTGKEYLREVWVTVHDAPDTVVRTSHFHSLED